jgi:hypothetical protein
MTGTDRRNIATGHEIPKEGYCDQPYVVFTKEGDWVCVMTTGPGPEGHHQQHVVSTVSGDQGRTWSPLVDIEPNGPPEASWAMPLVVPSGRIYAFYVHNSDNLREVPSPDGPPYTGCDTFGHYVFKYSDDGGRSWSAERYEIPLRTTKIDRDNATGGAVRFFWGVGKPIVHGGSVYFGAAKVGDLVRNGHMASSEGIFLTSDNILTESDPAKIRWEMLPDGDVGLKAPHGPVADEHNLGALNDGSLYCTYRTVDGFLCHAYSRDGGRTWGGSQYATYSPDGRPIKHPRAASFVWKASNGNYLLWYHNHGGNSYMSRNPAWLCGGIERDGFIHWSQPEIVLYDDDTATRISYPDFLERDGRFWITETQKTIASVHEIDPALLNGLWHQAETRTVTAEGLALAFSGDQCGPGRAATMPALQPLANGGGFTIDLWLTPQEQPREQELFNTRTRAGRGIALSLLRTGALRISIADGTLEQIWESDPGLLTAGHSHHAAVIVDGGPKIILFVIDSVLNDGGNFRPRGWSRFPHALGHVNGLPELVLDPTLTSTLHNLRLYDRPLRVSEAVANYQAMD